MTSSVSCLDILRRTNPDDAEEILAHLTKLFPAEVAKELQGCASVPLKVSSSDGKKSLTCSQIKSNSQNISQRLFKLQSQFSDIFDIYRELYYGKSSLSSVCLWDEGITEGGFAGCFLIRNTTKDSVNGKDDSVAKWSSIHILEALHTEEKWMYAITSTIFISITHPEGTISGSLTKQHKRVCNSSKERHIANVGKLIEDVEHEMRSQLEGVYIPKTRVDYIMNSRKQEGSGASELRKDLADAVLRRGVEGRVKLS